MYISNGWNFKETKLCHPKLLNEVTWWRKRRRPAMEPKLTVVTSLCKMYCGTTQSATVSCRRSWIPDDIPLRDDWLQTNRPGLWRSSDQTHAYRCIVVLGGSVCDTFVLCCIFLSPSFCTTPHKDFNTDKYHNNVPVWDYRKAFFAVYFASVVGHGMAKHMQTCIVGRKHRLPCFRLCCW